MVYEVLSLWQKLNLWREKNIWGDFKMFLNRSSHISDLCQRRMWSIIQLKNILIIQKYLCSEVRGVVVGVSAPWRPAGSADSGRGHLQRRHEALRAEDSQHSHHVIIAFHNRTHSEANRLIDEVVQSRRRPLLGPSPGCWKRLLALSHLRHY